MHVICEPAILYFGTPVVLISSTNEDGSANLAPMSSAFWLGWRCLIGLAGNSKTPQNLQRTGECVLNLPSVDLAPAVNRLAKTTGSNPVPTGKVTRGYRFVKDKFGLAELTPAVSQTVSVPRALQCPVNLEARVTAIHDVAAEDDVLRGRVKLFELRVQRVHIASSILADGEPNKIDSDRWRPLIMSFQKFYGLGSQVFESTLAEIPEAMYRSPDVDLARTIPPIRPVEEMSS